jgi:outer membrane protein
MSAGAPQLRSSGPRGGPCAPSGLFAIAVAVLFLFLAAPLGAEESPGASPAQGAGKGFDWLGSVLRPYQGRKVVEVSPADEMDLAAGISDGRLTLSVSQLRTVVLKNNIDVASARYIPTIAETDVLRASGGGAPRGSQGTRIPSSLFSGAIGAGVGDTTSAGGTTGAGGITSSARQVFARPRGTYDPSIAVNFSLDKTSSPLNTLVVAGVPEVGTRTTALQARYAQAFTSGTSVSISFNNQRQSSSQLFLRFNPAVVSSFSLVVTQQLLNGFGREVNRRYITVAENSRTIAREELRRQTIVTLAEAESLYWELVAARENVRVAERALAVARQLHEDNRKREEIGTISGIEVVTAASEVSARQRDLVAAQAVFEMRNAELLSMLSRQPGGTTGTVRIEASDPLPDPAASPLPRMDEVQAEAVRYRPELRQAEINLVNQDVAIRYTRNLLKPTLVLFGTLNSAGLYGNRVFDVGAGQSLVFPGGLSQAFRQVRSFSYPEYAYGFSFQIPIRNQSAQADNMRARLDRDQAETSLQQTRTRIALEVRNAMVALQQSRAQVESAAKAVELQKVSLTAEEERLLTGTSTPYEVIRRQRDLVRAEYEEVRARANYAKAKADLNRAAGRTPPEALTR